MLKGKITLKLFLIVTCSLVFLVGIVIAAQFFIVSRLYLTTEYTKEREKALFDGSNFIVDSYNYDNYIQMDKEINVNMLNQYANGYTAYCFITDKSGMIKYKSDNISELNKIYIDNIEKMLQDSNTISNTNNTFRINGFFNIPSKYKAVFRSLSHNDFGILKKEDKEYFVAVTKEVYTNENYLILRKYSIYLFIIVVILGIILSVIFSYIITRPILKIRDAAVRMTSLDFTHKCNYSSKDEIGELSASLNFLSEKLNGTINQLEEANEKLKGDLDVQREIDQLRKNFIADVSHEFKTPLTLIRGFNEVIVTKKIQGDELQEAQNIIMNEVDRMDKLVEELLDLAKLESSAYELHEIEFDCNEFLNTVAEKYSIIMEEHNINFYREINDKNVFVFADKSRIEQVVMNFINNAMFNTPKYGDIILKLESQKQFVSISVFNQGSHIEETEIDKIWDKFYRTDRSRSKKTGGTGLGLAICKQILDKHKSLYGAENVDDGVRFYFTLKLDKRL